MIAAVRGLPLGALHHDGHVAQQRVAAAVVEVQVRAHDHVRGRLERGGALVDRRALGQLAGEVLREPADASHRVDAHVGVQAGVEHQAALRVLHQVREHRDPDLSLAALEQAGRGPSPTTRS